MRLILGILRYVCRSNVVTAILQQLNTAHSFYVYRKEDGISTKNGIVAKLSNALKYLVNFVTTWCLME